MVVHEGRDEGHKPYKKGEEGEKHKPTKEPKEPKEAKESEGGDKEGGSRSGSRQKSKRGKSSRGNFLNFSRNLFFWDRRIKKTPRANFPDFFFWPLTSCSDKDGEAKSSSSRKSKDSSTAGSDGMFFFEIFQKTIFPKVPFFSPQHVISEIQKKSNPQQ
jgi:hypothetical protein